MTEVGPVRQALIEEVGKCEHCGASPRKRLRSYPPELSELCCDEIHSGRGNRQKGLGLRFALLVVCVRCNGAMTDRVRWPEARKLALLRRRRPGDYDLVAYNKMVNEAAPLRIEPFEVAAWTT